jgi:hypothetical protein
LSLCLFAVWFGFVFVAFCSFFFFFFLFFFFCCCPLLLLLLLLLLVLLRLSLYLAGFARSLTNVTTTAASNRSSRFRKKKVY